jgi:hypothetical protein
MLISSSGSFFLPVNAVLISWVIAGVKHFIELSANTPLAIKQDIPDENIG